MSQNPRLASPSVEAKRERLIDAMTLRLGGARDLASLRRDVERLPESLLDSLLTHYAGDGSRLVW